MSTFQTLIASPSFHLTMFLLVGAAAVQGGVAVWAATSRAHWFWGAIAVWAAFMALLPIRAYQPAFVFAISSPLVVVLILAYRRLLQRVWPEVRTVPTGTLQFGLRDVLLAMTIIALWLAGLLHVSKQLTVDQVLIKTEVATIVAAAAFIPALTYCAAWGPRRWIAIVVLVIAVSAFAIFLQDAYLLYDFFQNVRLHDDEYALARILVLAIFPVELIALIAVGSLLAGAVQGDMASPRRGWAQAAIAAAALLVGIPLMHIYCQMLWLTPFPPSIAADANHYGKIVEIARRFNRNTTAEVCAASHAELLPLLNAANHVPAGPRIWSYDDNDHSPLRELARSLNEETKAAEARNDFDASADLAIANVRIGTMLGRGGVPIDEFTGDAIAGSGHRQLIVLRGKLSVDKSREVVSSLAQSLTELEPFETMWARGRANDERQSGWELRLEHVVYDLGFADFVRNGCRYARQRNVVTNRLLQTELAIRLFVDQHGRLPTRLEELAPMFLLQIPLDPYSDDLLIYRPSGNQFMLYSVGRNGIDDHGRFTNWRNYHDLAGYDFDLDTFTRP